MSDAHAEGDGHTAVGHVTLIVGPGDRFLSGVSYDTALLTSALATGLPVVASDIPAHREVIRRAGPGCGGPVARRRCPRCRGGLAVRRRNRQLLSSTDSCDERAARCTLPSAAEIVDQLLETLTAAIVSRP